MFCALKKGIMPKIACCALSFFFFKAFFLTLYVFGSLKLSLTLRDFPLYTKKIRPQTRKTLEASWFSLCSPLSHPFFPSTVWAGQCRPDTELSKHKTGKDISAERETRATGPWPPSDGQLLLGHSHSGQLDIWSSFQAHFIPVKPIARNGITNLSCDFRASWCMMV